MKFVVIAHGMKAHSVFDYLEGDIWTHCNVLLPQTRPALSRDRRCKRCAKARRKAWVQTRAL